jgi:hypothetical protein
MRETLHTTGLPGTTLDQLAPILNKAGAKATLPTKLVTMQELEAFVGHSLTGKSAIAMVTKGESAHFVLVEGFVQRNGRRVVQILDSNEGARFFVPVEEFAERFGRRGQAVLIQP